MRHFTKLALAGAALAAFAAPAQAAVYPACSINDISPTAEACAGFVGGNLLAGSPTAVSQAQALLNSIGFTGNAAVQLENLSPLMGSQTVDFATLLNGITFIGLHYGNGIGSPGNPNGDTTAFYRLSADNVDVLRIAYNASSNAVLYQTGSAVPEPATWAMMLIGFGAAGYSLRRRPRVAFQAA